MRIVFLSVWVGLISLMCGCATGVDLEYRSEEENQLSRGEELIFAQKARVYAQKNSSTYKITASELAEVETIAPQIRSYCSHYKYGDISASWTLSTGSILTVTARGRLDDHDTKMGIKFMRIEGVSTKKALTPREQLQKQLNR